MSTTAKKLNKKFSYADYLKWPLDERFELIDGTVYDMTPAPGSEHQSLSGELFGNIWHFLKDKTCRVFAAPFDVRLSENDNSSDNETFTVVQPDISVICDQSKIDDKGCNGAPDLVIEILSPSTAYKDETDKMLLYRKHGVKEYWIVNPEAKYIMIYRHNGVKFDKPEYYSENDILESKVLQGLKINLTEVWSKD